MTAKKTVTVATNADDREYHAYIELIGKRLKGVTGQLYTTDVSDLFESYLAGFPLSERQYHNCNCCKRFIETYGGLVTINDDGTLESPLWSNEDAPELYQGSVRAMLRQVKKAKVNGVFVSKETVWGTPKNVSQKTGATWQHLSAVPTRAMIHTDRVKEAHQVRAERHEDYGMVCRAAAEYSTAIAAAAVNLLQAEALYRSDRFMGPARWFHDLMVMRGEKTGKVRDNLTWKAVGTAPTGFAHVKSTIIGTLLDDLSANLTLAEVKRRFAALTNPTVYQRATVAPTEGAIAKAEKLFAQLDLAPALDRRYATLSELPALLWAPIALSKKTKNTVFGHLQTRSAVPVQSEAPTTTITWDKFQRTVLPTALNIEAKVPASANHFAALVTAANEDAKPILQWDLEENRNPFSWYYASGVDAEMNRRLTAAGARTTGNDIRYSGMWDNLNDLDIHSYTPTGHHIYYGDKRPRGQSGWLDVDMNAGGPKSMTPVENIRWETGTAPDGHYRFEMHLYGTHGGYGPMTPFRAEIEVAGQVFSFTGTVSSLERTVVVAEFDYVRGQPVRIGNTVRGVTAQAATSSANKWNVTPGAFVPVVGVVKSPNLWDAPMTQQGNHAFFLLKDCYDTQQGVGRGFFNEMLRGDLREVRSVMEAYAASASIAGAGEGNAAGIGISSEGTDDLTLRVTSATGQTLYKIDRWD